MVYHVLNFVKNSIVDFFGKITRMSIRRTCTRFKSVLPVSLVTGNANGEINRCWALLMPLAGKERYYNIKTKKDGSEQGHRDSRLTFSTMATDGSSPPYQYHGLLFQF